MGIKRTVSIRQIDLWVIEPLESKKMMQKIPGDPIKTIPLFGISGS